MDMGSNPSPRTGTKSFKPFEPLCCFHLWNRSSCTYWSTWTRSESYICKHCHLLHPPLPCSTWKIMVAVCPPWHRSVTVITVCSSFFSLILGLPCCFSFLDSATCLSTAATIWAETSGCFHLFSSPWKRAHLFARCLEEWLKVAVCHEDATVPWKVTGSAVPRIKIRCLPKTVQSPHFSCHVTPQQTPDHPLRPYLPPPTAQTQTHPSPARGTA